MRKFISISALAIMVLLGVFTSSVHSLARTNIDSRELGDLLILDSLFGRGDADLGNLIILDELFDNGQIGRNGRTNLGDLLILDQLFNNGIFGTSATNNAPVENQMNGRTTGTTENFGRLFILDRLFNGNGGIFNR